MANSASFPATLRTEVYPSSDAGPFPEFQLSDHRSDRYLPGKRPVGVCISGGGPRSFSAGIGQMRALNALGLLDLVGAVSCVSGGTWFGTLFNYAPESIDDAILLGPVVPPGQLTLNDISNINPRNIGSSLPFLTNTLITAVVAYLEYKVRNKQLPQNRVYSRTLNDLLLDPFQIANTDTFFALDDTSVSDILHNNPNSGLTKSNFYTVRGNRPYFIAGATQVFPTGQGSKDVLRHFEYTPLYTGTPQLDKGAGPQKQDFGGGYAQSFAFDSATPQTSTSPVTVPTPGPIFLLSDVMGSSGAAPAALLDDIGLSGVGFPEFNYWPAVDLGGEPSALYSFADGGVLEDVGIVPLLRRRYPLIIAFVNAELPIGDTSGGSVDGISGQVSRLFGLIPAQNLGNTQDTQVFGTRNGLTAKQQFQELAQGLKNTQYTGAYHFDLYSIQPGNSFGVPPYAGTGDVGILWYYLNRNLTWEGEITDPKIRSLLNSSDPTNYFKNFPNLATVFQNKTKVLGTYVPELLYYTIEQIQLLAHLTAFNLGAGGGKDALMALRDRCPIR
jgi:hypothetical protein